MNLPSKEAILEASDSYPQAEKALRKLFPEAFKHEWKVYPDFTDFNLMHSSDVDGAICFRKDGRILFWAKVEIVKQGMDGAKIEDGYIYKKRRK